MTDYRKRCRGYKPSLITTCSGVSLFISVTEFLVAIYEYILARDGSLVPAICSGVFFFFSIVTLIYCIGILKANECMILPLITSQMILVAALGLLVIIWWICTLLALFDLVHYRSPIADLSTKEFFVLAGVICTVLFILSFKGSHLLYKGYKRVEKDNFYKRRIGNGVLKSMSRSTTIPPTHV